MKRIFSVVLCALIFLSIVAPEKAHADTGPKPSVNITITGLSDEFADTEYYGTLLSQYDSTGPASAYDGINNYYYGDNPDIWQKFVDYKDQDGFYYLQEDWKCTGNDEFAWTYYPPKTFKVLLYFTEYDTFVSSDVIECYAFDSYFEVNLTGVDITAGNIIQVAAPEKNYNYTKEILSLAARVVITILVELLVAYILFGLRKKNHLQCILTVNIITQLLLNIVLNIIDFNRGPYAFIIWYVILEIAIFVVEAALYTHYIYRRDRSVREGRLILYTFVANLASLLTGIFVAVYLPVIF